jgi:hypothetical protein
VFKFRSVNNIVIAPASEVNKSIAVTKMAHTNSESYLEKLFYGVC